MTRPAQARLIALFLLVGLLGACSAEDAQSLKDQAAEVAAAADSLDMAALEELVAAGNEELLATTRDLRRRLKRMEERLAALEADLAAVSADAEGVAGIEATTGQLAEQVQTLSQELERLSADDAPSWSQATVDPNACAADGGTWDPVLAACLK